MKIPTLARILPLVLAATPLVQAAPGPSYRFLHAIPIGGDGGWDYLTVDAAARRLYVAHATKIVVVDIDRDAIVGEIDGLSGVHGFAVAPKLGRGFASNGRANTVSVVDLATLATLATVVTEKNPDAILLEPSRSEIYAFNGRSQSATAIAADTGKVVATVPLGGKPEFSQADAGRVFVNLEDQNAVAVIDAASHLVVNRWPIAPGEEASGLDIDRTHHRLFLGCDNAKLLVLDSQDGHVVAALPAGKGIDAAAFDPGTQLAFTSNGGDGTVTVVHEDTPDKFAVVQTLSTERGARTMAVDPRSHRLYLASAQFEPAKSGDTKRPKIVAGTFKLLVYELKN